MGDFDDVNGAKKFGVGDYLGDGKHHVRVLKIIYQTSEDPTKKNAKQWIAEVEVLKSTNPAYQPGTKKTVYRDMGWVGTKADIKEFTFAVAPWQGYTKEQLETFTGPQLGALIEQHASADNPLGRIGAELEIEGFTKPTKTKGTPFTRYTFKPIPKEKKAPAASAQSAVPAPAAG